MAGGCDTVWYKYNGSHSCHVTEGIWFFCIFNPHLQSNYKVLQGGILSLLMKGSVLVLVQVLGERDLFWV